MTGKVLLIGADGLIGKYMAGALGTRDAIGTTRRAGTTDHNRVWLDIFQQERFDIPSGIGAAVILAGGIGYEYCEDNPEESARLNLECVPALVSRLLDAEIFTVFLSSMTVFGGLLDFPGETAAFCPTVAYGRQKAESERRIGEIADRKGQRDRLAVVRLSKVISIATRPLPNWLTAWRAGREVTPFSDLYFSPVTLDYIHAFVLGLVERTQSGVFHLSGERNMNYAEFCRPFAVRMGFHDALIRPLNSREAGVILRFSPRNAGLGMAATLRETGVGPQIFEAVLDALAAENESAISGD